MRSWPLLLALLVALTSGNGQTIWVNPDQVVSVHAVTKTLWHPGCRTDLLTSFGRLCVQQEPEDVVSKLGGSK